MLFTKYTKALLSDQQVEEAVILRLKRASDRARGQRQRRQAANATLITVSAAAEPQPAKRHRDRSLLQQIGR